MDHVTNLLKFELDVSFTLLTFYKTKLFYHFIYFLETFLSFCSNYLHYVKKKIIGGVQNYYPFLFGAFNNLITFFVVLKIYNT